MSDELWQTRRCLLGAFMLAAFTCSLAAPKAPQQGGGTQAAQQGGAQALQQDATWVPDDPAVVSAKRNPQGARVFASVCAACHEHGVNQAPAVFLLREMPSKAIYRVLTQGAMQIQAQGLSDADKLAVADYLGGTNAPRDAKLAPPACSGPARDFDRSQPPSASAWGLTLDNQRHVGNTTAGLSLGKVSSLKLKWALGFDGATRARSQPTFAAGAIYVGAQDGSVYALDRATGCSRWHFQATAEVRTAIIVSGWTSGDADPHPLAYFGDFLGNVYAVDAFQGTLVWRDHTDTHPATTLTGAPALFEGRLYVPVSTLEKAVVSSHYDCCSARGSIVAYDALTGARLWQRYLTDSPVLKSVSSAGVKQFGPSGVSVWNTPAIDAKSHTLYFGTSNNYSSPATAMSDSIVALDASTGKVKWSYQATSRDAWNVGCGMVDMSNCPEENGPDYDFAAATILATTSDGHDLVLGGQKSGWVYALERRSGQLVWKTKVGRGGVLAGVYFGMAVHGYRLFVPINDAPDGRRYDEAAPTGLYAIDLQTGRFLWRAPIDADVCLSRGDACAPGIAAAVTATDDLVMTGAGDGRVRLYAADTGRLVWQYDTTAPVATVGGGMATGGSMGGGAGPVAYEGTLVIESGYGFAGRMPGNLMLVFGVDDAAARPPSAASR